MTHTTYKLTNTEVEDILHNMSAAELWALNANVEPINLRNEPIDTEKTEKIYALMDLTELEYDSVERLLYNPYNASLSDIHIYCEALDIDVIEFIKKALS